MTVYKGKLQMDTLAGKPTYVDITDGVRGIVKESGIKEGIVVVISCHTTCAVFSEEYDHDHTPDGDTFLQADLSDGLGQDLSPSSTTGKPTATRAFSTLRRSKPGPTSRHGCRAATARFCGTVTPTLRSTIVGSNQTFEVGKRRASDERPRQHLLC